MKKGNLHLLTQSYKLIEQIQPGTIFIQFLGSLFTALRPFINIYFPARIIWILGNTKSIPDLVLYTAISVSLNMILTILETYCTQKLNVRRQQIYQEEHNRISQKIYTMDYQLLEDTEFETLINRYRERYGSPFHDILNYIGSWVSGLVGIVCSCWMLWPLFKSMFTRTGEGVLQSPWISVILLIAIAVAAAFIAALSGIIHKKNHKFGNEYYGILRIFYYYSDMLSNYNSGKEVRLFAQKELIEQHATERFRTDSLKVWEKIGNTLAVSSACNALIGALLGFGIYSIIALKASAGLFGVDQLVKFVGSFFQVITAITSIASTIGRMNDVYPRLREYYEILDKPNKARGAMIPESPKSISFKNVRFRYPSTNEFALNDVSIDIPVGERIAIVGENGSGKTTFVKLLSGLYDADDGEICVNGINIKKYDPESFYQLFSVIFQDFQIFSLSLAENVACSTEYEVSRVEKVLEQVDFKQRSAKMKDGLNSMLYHDCDPEGIEISGGEAQKLALARTLYKDAPIIILDEPTAALDPFAEQTLYQRFDSLVGDKTVFYISHRLSSCFFCNKIAVFDKGNLVQFGTHEELIANIDGKYYELWMAQAQYYV